MGWAIGLKYSEGFTRLMPTVLTLIGATFSFVLLALAMKTLPVGTAYAVWTGIGTLGTAILAVVLFHAPVTTMRVAGVGLILAGIAALNLALRLYGGALRARGLLQTAASMPEPDRGNPNGPSALT